MAKWYTINTAKASGAIDIRIFDDIGGWGYSAADFARDLDAAGKGEVKLRINTPGGDVFQGFAIYNIMNRIRDRVTVVIEGLAASMGSVIAMAGKKIIMPENTMMMIHDPAGMAAGGPEQMASFADALDKMRDSIVKAYADRTGMKQEDIRSMMSKETWLSAQEAVNAGFADEIEKPIQMAAHAGFNLKCYLNVPQSFGTIQAEEDDMKDEITRLCALFGKPQLAEGFITAKKSVADVLTALEGEKQKDEAAVAAAVLAAKKPDDAAVVTEASLREKIVAEMSEIKALCSLAGLPDKADGFIAAKKSVKDVITALAEAKQALADAGTRRGKPKPGAEVDAHHHVEPQAEGSAAIALDPAKVWDKYNRTGAVKK